MKIVTLIFSLFTMFLSIFPQWMVDNFGEQNLYAAAIGWFTWTVVMLSMYKDENEKTWSFWAYTKEHWDNWLANFAVALALLWIGKNKLDIPMVDGEGLQWKDIYYLGSGFFLELLIKAIKFFKSK